VLQKGGGAIFFLFLMGIIPMNNPQLKRAYKHTQSRFFLGEKWNVPKKGRGRSKHTREKMKIRFFFRQKNKKKEPKKAILRLLKRISKISSSRRVLGIR